MRDVRCPFLHAGRNCWPYTCLLYTSIGANGSRYFDNEGVATEPRTVFDKGVLKTYFIDTYNGKKMDIRCV